MSTIHPVDAALAQWDDTYLISRVGRVWNAILLADVERTLLASSFGELRRLMLGDERRKELR